LRGHVQVFGQLGFGFKDVDYNHGHILDYLLCAVKHFHARDRAPGIAGRSRTSGSPPTAAVKSRHAAGAPA
jgi:hypothetical protein